MNPVIILDLSFSGLEIVRALHKHTRIYGFYIETESNHYEIQTTLCDKIKYANEDDLLNKLLTLIKHQDKKPVLLLTSDQRTSFYNRYRAILKDKVLIDFPSECAFTSLVDKNTMSKFAISHGYLIPKTTAISSLNISEISCPCFVKPKYKDSRWKSSLKGVMCNTTNDIQEIFEETDAELLAQEWINGSTTNIFFSMVYVSNGKVISQCVGRKIREWPLIAGTGTCLQQVYNPEVKDITKRFFESVQGYEGYGSLELKYNEVDNSYYIIEPTVGRFDFNFGFGRSIGHDFTKLIYEQLTGQTIKSKPRYRSYWILEYADSLSIWFSYKNGTLNYWHLVKSIFSSSKHLLAFNDIGPILAYLNALVKIARERLNV